MKVVANEYQIAKLIANAYNESIPVGLGILHYDPTPAKAEDFIGVVRLPKFGLDYVKGRMMKLRISRTDMENVWEVGHDHPPNHEYQSWARTFPTYRALIQSVPQIKILED